MNTSLEELMTRLRADYLAAVPARLDMLSTAAGQLETGDSAARTTLLTELHRLAGSAGAYGFGQVTALCRQAEAALRSDDAPTPELGPHIRQVIEAIRAAFARGPTTPPIAP